LTKQDSISAPLTGGTKCFQQNNPFKFQLLKPPFRGLGVKIQNSLAKDLQW